MTLPDNTIRSPWDDPKGVRQEVADAVLFAAVVSDTLRPVFTEDDARYMARLSIARLRDGAIRDTLRHCLTHHLMTPAAAALILTTLGDPDSHTTAAALDGPGRETEGPDMATNRPNPDADLVTVCDACLRASCWRGEFYCDNYVRAGTVRLKHATLERLGLEHADYRTTDAEYLNR